VVPPPGALSIALGAAVILAQTLIFAADGRENTADVSQDAIDALLETVGETAAAALQDSSAAGLLDTLRTLRRLHGQDARAAAEELAAAGAVPATSSTTSPEVREESAKKVAAAIGSAAASSQPAGVQEDQQQVTDEVASGAPQEQAQTQSADQTEEGATEANAGDAACQDEEGDEEAEEKPEPSFVYQCRKCGVGLFHDLNILPHSTDGVQRRSRAWMPTDGSDPCTSVFVEPMSWMGNLEGQTGKLLCGNQRCRQKLGAFSWHGLPCSCGQWQSPAFQIHGSRLDCMPAGRRVVRGPAPTAVFR